MEILFERSYPQNLVDAIQLIQSMDSSGWDNVAYYDTQTNDEKLQKPVLIRIDKEKKGLETITNTLFKNGMSVVAIKIPSKKQLNLYEFALMMIELWPKIIRHAKNNQDTFVCKCNVSSGRIIPVPKLKL